MPPELAIDGYMDWIDFCEGHETALRPAEELPEDEEVTDKENNRE